jgi:ribonuclease HII
MVGAMGLNALRNVAGVDEAGRGPIAGPVCVAAVILDPAAVPIGLDDSKRLTPARRDRLFDEIIALARASCIVFVPPREIDRLNIREATLRGMAQAVRQLGQQPEAAVIDGRDVPAGLPCPGRAIIGGDGLHPAIMAASILAKVARDRAMVAAGLRHPGYGFERHKGYGSRGHLDALAQFGPTPLHRMSFAPLARV